MGQEGGAECARDEARDRCDRHTAVAGRVVSGFVVSVVSAASVVSFASFASVASVVSVVSVVCGDSAACVFYVVRVVCGGSVISVGSVINVGSVVSGTFGRVTRVDRVCALVVRRVI